MSEIPSDRHLTMVLCDACHKYENVSNAHYDETTQQVLCSSCKNDYSSEKSYQDYLYQDFCLEFSWLPCGFIENNMHILSKKYVRDALNDPNRYIIILDGHSSITAVNRKDISFIKLAASTHNQNDDYDMFFLWLQQIKHIDQILAYYNKTFNELTITEVFKFYEEKYVKDLFCSLDAFTEIVNLLCCTSRHSNSTTTWIYV